MALLLQSFVTTKIVPDFQDFRNLPYNCAFRTMTPFLDLHILTYRTEDWNPSAGESVSGSRERSGSRWRRRCSGRGGRRPRSGGSRRSSAVAEGVQVRQLAGSGAWVATS